MLVVAVRWGEASRRAAAAKMATLPVKAPRASANWESRLPGGVFIPRIHIPNRAPKLQLPKIPLALGGGMWHTISFLPVKRRDDRLPAQR